MPWENIGSVDTGEMPRDESWILFCLKLAKSYVDLVCQNDEDEEGKLDIMWSDHELGSYPSLGVWYDLEEPCRYISACERALDAFNNSVSWHELKEYYYNSFEDDDDYDDDDDDDFADDEEE